MLKPSFRDYDKYKLYSVYDRKFYRIAFRHNNGHVSRSQMRQCLLSNGILLSDEELYALEERFNDDVGFNYFWFLKEVEPNVQEEPLVK